jgi:hypothetical protein
MMLGWQILLGFLSIILFFVFMSCFCLIWKHRKKTLRILGNMRKRVDKIQLDVDTSFLKVDEHDQVPSLDKPKVVKKSSFTINKQYCGYQIESTLDNVRIQLPPAADVPYGQFFSVTKPVDCSVQFIILSDTDIFHCPSDARHVTHFVLYSNGSHEWFLVDESYFPT